MMQRWKRPAAALAVTVSLALASGLAWSQAALTTAIPFRYAIDNSPLELKPRANETVTPQVQAFLDTGKNPYADDAEALADGKKLYNANCQSCHVGDGSGRLGPSLIGEKWIYERAGTDIGKFEIIYAGASGAMQSFARRGMTMDQMLRIVAYVNTLKPK